MAYSSSPALLGVTAALHVFNRHLPKDHSPVSTTTWQRWCDEGKIRHVRSDRGQRLFELGHVLTWTRAYIKELKAAPQGSTISKSKKRRR